MKPTLALGFAAAMFMLACIAQSIVAADESPAPHQAILSHDSGDEIGKTILNSLTVLAWIIGPVGSALLIMSGAWWRSDPFKEMIKLSNLMIMVADSWLIAGYFL